MNVSHKKSQVKSFGDEMIMYQFQRLYNLRLNFVNNVKFSNITIV